MKIKELLKLDTGLLFAAAILYGISRAEQSMEMDLKEFIMTIIIIAVVTIFGIMHACAAEECEQ